jgi:ribonuclease P protein subunit POP4
MNIITKELIGSQLKVVDSKNKANMSIEGKIVDETKYTFVIETKKGKKVLMKKNIVAEICYKGKKYTINGEKITKRPHERISIR